MSDGSAVESPRLQELERLVELKDSTIEQLHETASAFKLLQEKQTAEINTRDVLLARKNERIEELLQQLHANDTALTDLQRTVHAKDAEIRDCREQLSKEEDEFAMLSAAMATKDQQLATKSDQILQLQDVERELYKDKDRLAVQLRKLEKQVDSLQPETMDACLSPRSFSENQLIQLRDDAIQAKTKEIWLLTGQNDQLRIQLDELEAEMETLQTRFVSKENDVAKRDRVIERLQAEMEALQVARQQAEGRERAIEIATTQNTKLLQALQAQESQTDELRTRLERTEHECVQLRGAHRQHLEKSAVIEVDALHKSKEVEHKSSLLTSLQDKLTRERKRLHEELSQERVKAQLEVEKLQSELVMRRNKQYELTLRVQQVDAQLHDARDQVETLSEKFMATQLRMEEAERVLQDALTWKRALEDELATCRREREATQQELLMQVDKARGESVVLRGQLSELKQSLLQSLDQDKQKAQRLSELKRSVDARDQLVVEHKERIARLVQDHAKTSHAKAESELEKKLLQDQLATLQRQMGDALRECMEQQCRVDDKFKRAVTRQQALEQELTREHKGKAKLLQMVLQPKAGGGGSSVLDLRDCWLADSDAAVLFAALETWRRTSLMRVDLRGNRLTSLTVHAVVQFFRKLSSSSSVGGGGGGWIRELDLRGNFISLDGLRSLANALETVALSVDGRSRDGQPPPPPFSKVVVVNGARIECLASAQGAPATTIDTIPVLCVDMTENGDPETLVQVPTTHQFASGYKASTINRRRRLGGGESDPPADAVLQEIYGLDLVSAFMGDPPKATAGTLAPETTSRNRRKSTRGTELDGAPSHSSLLDGLPVSSTRTNQSGVSTSNSPRVFVSSSRSPPLLSSSASLPRLS